VTRHLDPAGTLASRDSDVGDLTVGAVRPAYASVVLDVDSTLTRIEGIEWLAARRGAAISALVAEMTERATAGEVSLDEVYATRLGLVQPSRDDLIALGDAYVQGALEDARGTLAMLRARGIELTIVSGGIRQAVLPFAQWLGVSADRVHAVSVEFGGDGRYMGFDASSPLARRNGKPTVVRALGLGRPLLALGDGSTDADLKTNLIAGRPTVDAFAAFVGVASRPSVVAVADYVVRCFAELPSIVLGGQAA
jgi:phosphoserine phosphatase